MGRTLSDTQVPPLELSLIAELTETLNRREGMVTLAEVDEVIRATTPVGDLTATVRQRKIDSSAAKLEEDGYLIYPFFSLAFVSGEWRRLADLTETGQSAIIISRKTHSVLATSEFALVSGHIEDNALITAVHRLLHAYFVINELERCAERIVLLLGRGRAQNTEYTVRRFATLRQINFDVFSLGTTIANLSPADDLRLEDAGELAFGSKTLVELARLTRRVRDQHQSLSERLLIEGENIHVHAIPIKRGSRDRASEFLLMISHEGPIPILAIKINEAFVRLIIDKLMERGRQDFERHIQERVRNAATLRSTDPMQFKTFCEWVTQQLYLLTNSHSVTIRQFSSYTNSLDLIACYPGHPDQQDAMPSIPCNERTSVNAFCFRKTEPRAFVYLQDLGHIPDAYQREGLESVFMAREHSRSEICLAIGDPPLRVGTLNLESPNFAAYEMDTQFLQSIAFHIQQFLNAMNTSGDAWWLSQLSLTHMATHELRDFKETLDSKQRKALEGIIHVISPAEHLDLAGGSNWAVFLNFIRKLHNRRPRVAPNEFESIWTIDGIIPTDPIGERYVSSLKLIAQSLMSNTQHSEYTSNKISVVKSAVGGREVVTIDYNSVVSYLAPETLDEIDRRFTEPAMTGNGWHFGLFLIGVHSRLLGGGVEINPACRKEFDCAPFGFRVRIPLPEGEK